MRFNFRTMHHMPVSEFLRKNLENKNQIENAISGETQRVGGASVANQGTTVNQPKDVSCVAAMAVARRIIIFATV